MIGAWWIRRWYILYISVPVILSNEALSATNNACVFFYSTHIVRPIAHHSKLLSSNNKSLF